MGASNVSGIPKLMMAEAGNFPDLAKFYYEEVVQRGQQLVAGVLKDGIDRGEFRALDLAITSRLAFAPLVHLAIMKHSFANCAPTPVDPREVVEEHIDVFLRGISREAGRA
jgi:hypothetical protein